MFMNFSTAWVSNKLLRKRSIKYHQNGVVNLEQISVVPRRTFNRWRIIAGLVFNFWNGPPNNHRITRFSSEIRVCYLCIITAEILQRLVNYCTWQNCVCYFFSVCWSHLRMLLVASPSDEIIHTAAEFFPIVAWGDASQGRVGAYIKNLHGILIQLCLINVCNWATVESRIV